MAMAGARLRCKEGRLQLLLHRSDDFWVRAAFQSMVLHSKGAAEGWDYRCKGAMGSSSRHSLCVSLRLSLSFGLDTRWLAKHLDGENGVGMGLWERRSV